MIRRSSGLGHSFVGLFLCLLAQAAPAGGQGQQEEECRVSPDHLWNGYGCMVIDRSPSRCGIRVPPGVTPRCIEGSGRTSGPGWWYVHVGGQRTDWNQGTDATCASAENHGGFQVGHPVGWGLAGCMSAGTETACQRIVELLGWCVEGASAHVEASQPQDRTALREFILSHGALESSPRTGNHEVQVNAGSEPVSFKPNSNPSPDDEMKGVSSRYRCVKKEISLEQNPDEFVMFNPHAGIVYPGALIQGRTFETGGSMTPIVARRGPGVVTLALLTGSGERLSRLLGEATFQDVNQAMNDLLREFRGGTTAKASFTVTQIHNQEHLAAEMEANVSGVNFNVGASLSVRGGEETTKMLMKLRQEYFTMVFAPPPGGAEEFFAPGVTAADLQGQIGPDNPAVYVASVTYGRQLYLLFESRQSAEELATTLNAAGGVVISVDAQAKAEYARRMSEVTVQSFALGGSATGALAGATAVARDGAAGLEAMWRFVVEGANFSPDSPGAAISYKLANVADHRPLRLSSTTNYTIEECALVKAGCDGAEGSTKVVDACGVCGGDDACRRPCPAQTVEFGNDHAFIWIDLPATAPGTPDLTWDDVGIYKYVFPRCFRVKVEDLSYTCIETPQGGKWRRSGEIIRDANCYDNGNRRQPHLRVGTRG